MRLAIFTLGCRLNFAETEEIFDFLRKERFIISNNSPEIIIVRGCSVTKKAERETRLTINQLRKKEKKAFIIATGCIKESFFSPSANLILPKKKENKLVEEIKKLRKEKFNFSETINPQKPRTRSFIKIQDGCENYCSYCLIPYLRGKEKSRSFKEILKKIKEKERDGYQEIVLTGVNIANWKEKDKDLVWLIKEILKETKIPRIRISSIWPNKINDDFISLFRNKRLCRHLHLSLQSLSQNILKRMNRNYQLKEIEAKIKKIRKSFPDLTLTADIIVGFPSETEKEFKETLNFLKKIGLAKIHVFRYSLREGTASALMKNQIKEDVKKKRAKILISLSKKLNKKWREKFLKKTRTVLFEQKKDGFWQGLTDNYLKVFVKNNQNLVNQILPVKLKKLYKDGILGEIVL